MWYLLVAIGAGYLARCLQSKAQWSRKRLFDKNSPIIREISVCSTCCGNPNAGEKLVYCTDAGDQLLVDRTKLQQLIMDANLRTHQVVHSHDGFIRLAANPSEGGLICGFGIGAAIVFTLLFKNAIKEKVDKLTEETQGVVKDTREVLDELKARVFLEAKFSQDKTITCGSIQKRFISQRTWDDLCMVQKDNPKDSQNLLYEKESLDSLGNGHISTISTITLRDGISYGVCPSELEKRLLKVIQQRQDEQIEELNRLIEEKLLRNEQLSRWRKHVGLGCSGEYDLHDLDPPVIERHSSVERWNGNYSSEWCPMMRTGSASSLSSEESIISIDLTASNHELVERCTIRKNHVRQSSFSM